MKAIRSRYTTVRRTKTPSVLDPRATEKTGKALQCCNRRSDPLRTGSTDKERVIVVRYPLSHLPPIDSPHSFSSSIVFSSLSLLSVLLFTIHAIPLTHPYILNHHPFSSVASQIPFLGTVQNLTHRQALTGMPALV